MKLQFVLPLTDFKTYITLSTFRVISIFVFLSSSLRIICNLYSGIKRCVSFNWYAVFKVHF